MPLTTVAFLNKGKIGMVRLSILILLLTLLSSSVLASDVDSYKLVNGVISCAYKCKWALESEVNESDDITKVMANLFMQNTRLVEARKELEPYANYTDKDAIVVLGAMIEGISTVIDTNTIFLKKIHPWDEDGFKNLMKNELPKVRIQKRAGWTLIYRGIGYLPAIFMEVPKDRKIGGPIKFKISSEYRNYLISSIDNLFGKDISEKGSYDGLKKTAGANPSPQDAILYAVARLQHILKSESYEDFWK